MALDKDVLKQGLQDAMAANITNATAAQTLQLSNLAGAWADVIYAFVTSATIVYTGGLSSPDGPVDGMFVGNLE